MQNVIYVVIAYAVFWFAVVVFLFRLWQDQRQLDKKLRRLEKEIAPKQDS